MHRAIEAFREKHQGPVLSKASELFSRLTLGDHSGSNYWFFGEDDRPVLVAIRKNGEQVAVEGLSDGTRDQLYLALRLAAIEYHVGTVAACPVILDDILINSDDARAFAALDVIGDLAKLFSQGALFHSPPPASSRKLGIKAGARLIELDTAGQSVEPTHRYLGRGNQHVAERSLPPLASATPRRHAWFSQRVAERMEESPGNCEEYDRLPARDHRRRNWRNLLVSVLLRHNNASTPRLPYRKLATVPKAT